MGNLNPVNLCLSASLTKASPYLHLFYCNRFYLLLCMVNGPKIRQFLSNPNFISTIAPLGLLAWSVFDNVFLGNTKSLD